MKDGNREIYTGTEQEPPQEVAGCPAIELGDCGISFGQRSVRLLLKTPKFEDQEGLGTCEGTRMVPHTQTIRTNLK